MEKQPHAEHPQTFGQTKTPSRGKINSVYAEQARKQAEELRKKKQQERTK